MRSYSYYISAVVINPYGLTGGYGDARACSILNRNGAVSGVVDDVCLLDSRHDEVITRSGSTSEVEAQVTCGLGGVRIRQRERDIGASEGDVCRASDSLFQSSAEVDVRDVTPSGGVLTCCHQLDFKVAVCTSHLRSLRRYLYPYNCVAIINLRPHSRLAIVNRHPVSRLVVVDNTPYKH